MVRTAPRRTRRATVAALVVLLVASLVGVGAAPAPAGAVASTDWLGELNLMRSVAGLAPVSHVSAWSGRNLEHSRWMVYNDLIFHGAIPGTPWYTANANIAGQRSNLTVSTGAKSNRDTIDGWMSVPFHGIGMIDPDLTRVGFASYLDSADAGLRFGAGLDIISDAVEPGHVAPPAPTYPVVWPRNGSTIHLTRYGGAEAPNPLSSCPGYGSRASVGQPLYVQFGSSAGAVSQVSLTRVSDGAAMDRCWFDWTNYVNPNSTEQSLGRNVLSTRNAVIVMPGAALEVGQQYRLTVVRNGVTASSTFMVGTSSSPTPRNPIGSLDLVSSPQKGKLRVAGWAADWDAPTTALSIDVLIDGVKKWSITANLSRTDVGTIWPALGSAHGFSSTSTVTPGWRTACVLAKNVGPGADTNLGCKKIWVADPLSPFYDVLSTSQFFGSIMWMVDNGYASGYPNGNFQPLAPVTRQVIASILYKIAGSPPVSDEPLPFSDIPPDHPFRDPIAWMVAEGITNGYPDGQFKPTARVTRQVAAAFIWRMENKPPPSSTAPTFTDVPPTHAFATPIQWMAGEGITNGYADNTFRPTDVVSRQHLSAFAFNWKA